MQDDARFPATARRAPPARALLAAAWLALAAGVAGAAPLTTSTPVNVSQTATATEKAKSVRLAYADNGTFRKAWLYTYLDGTAGRQNVYARVSLDDGASWQAPVLLSRDGAGAATGGQNVTTAAGTFVADNDMPMPFAPPITSGPQVTIAWNSAYCPADPTAGTSGPYTSAVQGTGDLDGDGTPDRPFHCLWVATTTDPALATWKVAQLTDGTRDLTNEVVAGNASGSGIGIAWQEDPAGLQPGEAEGPGDGGSGSHVTGGTNIWYTFAAKPDAATLRANIGQLSDNDVAGAGKPGASRPNLSFSGATAVVAYEETACVGGNGGKCVVYHSFAYNAPDRDAAGTVVSDPARNARRVRIVLQGAAAAGDSPLRTFLLWRESATAVPAAAADIVVRRGLRDTAARPGSTGFLGSDILADTPQQLTNVTASGGNANAHRAVIRGSSVALAYDATPDYAGADPARTAVPTATYDLFFMRSGANGAAGSWSSAVNLSNMGSPAVRVVEPRLVPTPGTVVNPITGVPDAGDQQDTDILYVAYGTEANTVAGNAGQVFIARTTSFGARFEEFTGVSTATSGQSEAQLRPTPDGRASALLWMQEQTAGDPQSKDAMFAIATAAAPDLVVTASSTSTAPGQPATVSFDVYNKGPGDARNVTLTGSLPTGLTLVGVGETGTCQAGADSFTCTWSELLAGQHVTAVLATSASTAGDYQVSATLASADPDANPADDTTTVTVAVADALPPAAQAEGGGGCTMAPDGRFDPLLPLLAILGATSAWLRRRRGRATRAPGS